MLKTNVYITQYRKRFFYLLTLANYNESDYLNMN